MDDATAFIMQLSATGIPVDQYCGRTFTGVAAIVRDDAELVEAIRATTMPVGLEALPRGGWLVYPQHQSDTLESVGAGELAAN